MFMHIIWYAYIYSCNTTSYVCQCISCLSGTGAGFVASVFFGYVFLLIYQSFLLARNPIEISSLRWKFHVGLNFYHWYDSVILEDWGDRHDSSSMDDEFLDDFFQCSFFCSTKKNIYQIYQARFLFAVQPMKSVQLYAYKYQNLGPTDWGYCECLRWITCHAFRKTYKSLQIFTTKLNCFFWTPYFSGPMDTHHSVLQATKSCLQPCVACVQRQCLNQVLLPSTLFICPGSLPLYFLWVWQRCRRLGWRL